VLLLADENFNGRILRALQRRIPELAVVRIQETPLSGAKDPAVLEWAAGQDRVILTHDVSTLVGYAYERLREGRSMSGLIAVQTDCPIGQAVEDLELVILASAPGELNGRIIFVPL
jgi:hypothetical protein